MIFVGAAKTRVTDAVFLGAGVLIAVLIVFGHRGVAPSVGLMALAAALRASTWRQGFSLFSPARLAEPQSQAALAAALLCALIAASALWSPTPGAVKLGATVLLGIVCGYAIVLEAMSADDRRHRRLSAIFVGMIAAATAALLFEGLTGGALRGALPPADHSPLRSKDMTSLGRGVTAIAPLIFPAAILMRARARSWAPAALLMVAAMGAALQFSIFSNVAAIGAGAAAFLIALKAPRAGLLGVAALFIAALILAPLLKFLPVDEILASRLDAPPSWLHRLAVWRFSAEEALTNCLPLGCGADYARAIGADAGVIATHNWPLQLSLMPTHPHQAFVQIWLELGAPGVLLTLFALIALMRSAPRAGVDHRAAAAAAGAGAAILVSLLFEASIWQAWRHGVVALAAYGVALAMSQSEFRRQR